MRSKTATLSESAQWRSSKTSAAGRPPITSRHELPGRSEPGASSGAWPVARAAQLGHPVVVGRQLVAQRVEEQLEGPAEAARVGLAGEHERVVGQAGEELAHEPGLADAGLAADSATPGVGVALNSVRSWSSWLGPSHHHRAQTGTPDSIGRAYRPALGGEIGCRPAGRDRRRDQARLELPDGLRAGGRAAWIGCRSGRSGLRSARQP